MLTPIVDVQLMGRLALGKAKKTDLTKMPETRCGAAGR
jgi:hypothetical protein